MTNMASNRSNQAISNLRNSMPHLAAWNLASIGAPRIDVRHEHISRNHDARLLLRFKYRGRNQGAVLFLGFRDYKVFGDVRCSPVRQGKRELYRAGPVAVHRVSSFKADLHDCS